jgi:hypothetical protein
MAERMRLHPKAAVALLESGDMERWFTTNGWTYPVRGTAVRGVAAVQQFFETMGLSRPPVVQVSETEVRMNPQPPEVVRWQVTLFTESKKWVYGLIESDVPWLKGPHAGRQWAAAGRHHIRGRFRTPGTESGLRGAGLYSR